MARPNEDAGTTVVAQRIDVWRERRYWRGQGTLHVEEGYDYTLSLELWDRAPVSAAPAGYADPWWARDADGSWWIVCSHRANVGRNVRTARHAAYRVDDEVRLRLSMLRASDDVVRPFVRSRMAGLGSPLATNVGWRWREDPKTAYLALPIDL